MKPRLLDLFCGAGGCSVGYHRAGFDVVGVDIEPQPNYPFAFHQGDALKELSDLIKGFDMHAAHHFWQLREFDVIHASPPCQKYSQANNIHGRTDHPDLIELIRKLLLESGKTYVIENVPGAPLQHPVMICGLALGLNVKRHRLFESNAFLFGTSCERHGADYLSVFGHTVLERGHQVGKTKKGGPIIRRKHVGTDRGRQAMGINWMNRDELSQAIPPAYTEHLGKQLIERLK